MKQNEKVDMLLQERFSAFDVLVIGCFGFDEKLKLNSPEITKKQVSGLIVEEMIKANIFLARSSRGLPVEIYDQYLDVMHELENATEDPDCEAIDRQYVFYATVAKLLVLVKNGEIGFPEFEENIAYLPGEFDYEYYKNISKEELIKWCHMFYGYIRFGLDINRDSK